MGKLYINYPMIESYLHLKAIPDVNYEESNILVSLQPGKKYKNLVKKETIIYKDIDFIHRLHDLLNEHFGITDDSIRDNSQRFSTSSTILAVLFAMTNLLNRHEYISAFA